MANKKMVRTVIEDCPHRKNGWCLDCVSDLVIIRDKLENAAQKMLATFNDLQIRTVDCPSCGMVKVFPDNYVDVAPGIGSVPTSGFCPKCQQRLVWADESGLFKLWQTSLAVADPSGVE